MTAPSERGGTAPATLPPPPLRIVFLGTPAFAATILETLAAGPDPVVAAFCRPDAPSGRGLRSEAPPVKQLASRLGIPVHQPGRWKDGEAVDALRRLAPDLAVVAAYGRLLPQAALDLPRFGCVNVHASLLPRWRGADPITRAILEGDAETGVSIMQVVLEMDAGPVLWRRSTPILATDTGGGLESRLADLGGAALLEALDAWRRGAIAFEPQDPSLVTFAPPLRKSDGRIDWSRPAVAIERAVRALDPWPGAFTERAGQPLKVWRAEVRRDDATGTSDATAGGAARLPGTVLAIAPDGVDVATGDGALRLLEVQAPGKRRMGAADHARGARVAIDERLGAPGGDPRAP